MLWTACPVMWKSLKSLPARLLPGVFSRLPGYSQVIEFIVPGCCPVACPVLPHTPYREKRPFWSRGGSPLKNKKRKKKEPGSWPPNLHKSLGAEPGKHCPQPRMLTPIRWADALEYDMAYPWRTPCHIVTARPPMVSAPAAVLREYIHTLNHELRHCREGAWHERNIAEPR